MSKDWYDHFDNCGVFYATQTKGNNTVSIYIHSLRITEEKASNFESI